MSLKDVYSFYQDYVKPLYCEIEARGNELPVELLFEIHAAFDHLKRFHLEQEEEDLSSKKAISHLKRGTLDVFKLKLKYFHDDVDSLLKNGVDLDLIDNGNFLPNLISAKNDVYDLARRARYSEGHKDPAVAFDQWMATSIKIDEFSEKILTQEIKMSWAKRKTFSFKNKDTVKGMVIGLLTGVISCYIYAFLTEPAKPAMASQKAGATAFTQRSSARAAQKVSGIASTAPSTQRPPAGR